MTDQPRSEVEHEDLAFERFRYALEHETARYPDGATFLSAEAPHFRELLVRHIRERTPVVVVYPDGEERIIRPVRPSPAGDAEEAREERTEMLREHGITDAEMVWRWRTFWAGRAMEGQSAADEQTARAEAAEAQVAQLKDQLSDESLGGRRPDYKDVDVSRAYMDGYVQAVADAIVADRCREVAKALVEKKERGSG